MSSLFLQFFNVDFDIFYSHIGFINNFPKLEVFYRASFSEFKNNEVPDIRVICLKREFYVEKNIQEFLRDSTCMVRRNSWDIIFSRMPNLGIWELIPENFYFLNCEQEKYQREVIKLEIIPGPRQVINIKTGVLPLSKESSSEFDLPSLV